jgi:hypothetical protein
LRQFAIEVAPREDGGSRYADPPYGLDARATGRALASPTKVKVGQTGVIQIIEDATGSRTITTYGSTWKFAGGTHPTLTMAANAVAFSPTSATLRPLASLTRS